MTAAALLLAAVLLSPVEAGGGPEIVFGVNTEGDPSKVTFRVASSGCTTRADFRVDVKDGVLSLVRLRRDACKAMPHAVSIAIPLSELGLRPGQRFTLANPIGAGEP
jgi:hypothetical protein